MPELPEVETVRRTLEPLVRGNNLLRLEIIDPKLRHRKIEKLKGKVTALSRHGKNLIFEIKDKNQSSFLAVHLRMTGNLIWQQSKSKIPGPAHLRARFAFANGALNFVDVRRFGTLRFAATAQGFGLSGVDPLSDDFSEKDFYQLLAAHKQELKSWLLRQDKIAGIGNIYASEILFGAKVHPFRLTNSLSPAEARAIYQHIRKVLERAVECCGTTFSDFRDGHGESGGFQNFLKVYDREGKPCRRCRTPIRRVLKNQRSTYFCPQCQRK